MSLSSALMSQLHLNSSACCLNSLALNSKIRNSPEFVQLNTHNKPKFSFSTRRLSRKWERTVCFAVEDLKENDQLSTTSLGVEDRPKVGEGKALFLALKTSRRLKLSIVIETDGQLLMHRLSRAAVFLTELDSVLEDILYACHEFVSVGCM